MDETKMTVKVYRPLLQSFSRQIKALHMMESAFLNSMIRGETPHLAEELRGKRMSAAARTYVSRCLKRMGIQQINIVVENGDSGRTRQSGRGSEHGSRCVHQSPHHVC